jgi:uncharacterized NAD(P)/FAD-binding protein YdhS
MSTPAPAFLNLAIVGTGPTGLYALHHLLASDQPLTITLFEAGRLGGVGSPYSPDAASATMLANIASIEIPPLADTYLDWLQRQPAAILQLYGADPATLHDRQFLPRLLLGAWFRDALERMLAEAPARGHRIGLREATRVTDVAPASDEIRLTFDTPAGPDSLLFSHVILATGHAWPEDPDTDARHFVSPWTGLIDSAIPPARVGILGTSLSAIDAAMAVACQHGQFDAAEDTFHPSPGSEALSITLMSRQGLLPEADFWCPLPYQPLRHLTPAAVAQEVAAGPDRLLDRLWQLMVAELAAADPDWSQSIGLSGLAADSFPDAYFAPRLAADPFAWAAANLAEVRRNAQARRTVGWRYAILRMHEPMERAVAHLTDADRARFDGLKRVFIDNYAAVPPQSIRRLLALHRAGCLQVLPLGEDYDLDHTASDTRVTTATGDRHRFDVFIDARGQRALGAADLPFPSLRNELPRGEVQIDPSFALSDIGGGRIFLPAAPYLLARLPFVQGITASADMGAAVARAILGQARRDVAA